MKGQLLPAGLAFSVVLPMAGNLYPESYRSGFLSCQLVLRLDSEWLRLMGRTSWDSLILSKRSLCSYLLGTFWKQSLQELGSRWQRLPQRLEDWLRGKGSTRLGWSSAACGIRRCRGVGRPAWQQNQYPSPFIEGIYHTYQDQSRAHIHADIMDTHLFISNSMALLNLMLLCLVSAATSANNSQSSVPESFAFITVTHTRGNSYKNIQTHIDRYAMLDCPIATELNIVWNNEEPPEQAPLFSRKAQWKRPVYFFATPNNSMDWRYKIPAESKAQVYFIVDDDVNIDCTELKRGFKKWQENAIGNIAPIVTYAVRFFEYTQQEGFRYGKVKERDMFTLGLVGLSFMSRHFMDLYYAKVPIIEAMRAIVREKNNCDDIGINWLIQYFYPELEVIHLEAVKGNLLANSPAIAQSTSSTHYPYRNQCIKQFTLLFGVNALRYKPINDKYAHPQWRIKPIKESIVLQKQKQLEALISGTGQEEKQKEKKTERKEGNNGNEEGNAVGELQDKLDDLKEENAKLQDERNSLVKQLEKAKLNQHQQTSSPQSQKQQFSINDLLLFSTLVLTILVILLAYKVIALAHQKKMLRLSFNQKGTIVSSVQADSSSQQ